LSLVSAGSGDAEIKAVELVIFGRTEASRQASTGWSALGGSGGGIS